MSLLSLLRYISSHPLNQNNKIDSIWRFFKWQISSRLNPYPIVYPFTEKSKLIIQKGTTGATMNLYCGLHEYNDMGFLLHFLREEDFFIDIGANVGSYTVLASSHVGANSFSFEPVPATFSRLASNLLINQIHNKVTAFNIALGSEVGSINFTSSFDTVNHVANNGEVDTILVPIETLDNILQHEKTPILLKIDVEGFETEVIKGASKTLRQEDLKAIIIELNGSGARYNYDEKTIHQTLINLDFRPFQYDPKWRRLTSANTFGSHNTIYIRDADFVQRRVSTASKIRILQSEI